LGRETTAVAAGHPHGVKVNKNREQAKHCANTMIGSGDGHLGNCSLLACRGRLVCATSV